MENNEEKEIQNSAFFDFIRAENPETVFNTLQKEDDYFVALVFSCISESMASSIFAKFELERQIKIQEQIAKGLKISASVIKAYEESFKESLKNHWLPIQTQLLNSHSFRFGSRYTQWKLLFYPH